MAAEKILVVEDESHIQDLLVFYLEGEGFEVEALGDGGHAIERLEGEPPSLVLLDIMLPRVSGVEILERIRQHDSWAAVPVLMLTAKSGESDVVRAFDLGADDYVAKPFQLEELLARIRRLLAQADRG